MTTNEVENFLGFPQGIMGPELMDNMQAQAERFVLKSYLPMLRGLELDGEIKKIHTIYDQVCLTKNCNFSNRFRTS